MAGSGSFLESFTAWQKESVYGTAVSSDMHKIPILTWDVNPAYDIYTSGMITGAAGESAPAFGVKRIAGTMTLEGGYSNLNQVFLGVLGSSADTVADGTTPFLNTYTPSASQPSFTVDASYGDVPTTKIARFAGVKFNTVELSFDAAQGFMNVNCDLLAQSMNHGTDVGVALGTYTTTQTHYAIQVQPSANVTTLDMGIGDSVPTYCIRAGTIRIDRGLTANRVCLGIDTIAEPVATRPMSVTGTFTVEHQSAAFATLNALTGKTVHTTTQLVWTDGTYILDMMFPKVVYTNISIPIQQGDSLVQTVTWKAYGTVSGSATVSEPLTVNYTSPLDVEDL